MPTCLEVSLPTGFKGIPDLREGEALRHVGIAGQQPCVLIKQCGEILRGEHSVTISHKLTHLPPIRIVCEQHSDAIRTTPRGEEGVTDGQ